MPVPGGTALGALEKRCWEVLLFLYKLSIKAKECRVSIAAALHHSQRCCSNKCRGGVEGACDILPALVCLCFFVCSLLLALSFLILSILKVLIIAQCHIIHIGMKFCGNYCSHS